MVPIPDEKVQEIRDRVDIVDIVGRYVELRRAGRNFKGLCPFHQERTPSFNVNPDRKGYKCFGCGAGGDAIRFVMEIEGKSFPEAVRKLAELVGIEMPQMGPSGGAQKQHQKDSAYAILRTAAECYENWLWNDPKGAVGRVYLERRGVSESIARQFRLGYAFAPSEAGWDALTRILTDRDLDLDLAMKLGLLGRSERTANVYDKFRGRLMFPIIAPGGEVIAFSGRVVHPHDQPNADGREPPKYVNSSESLLFTKGKSLFGLSAARPAIRTSKRAILVEGNFDVVKMHQWGHMETVAPLGTAMTLEQAQLLSRFAEQVVMCFDGDKAGKKAAWAALPWLLQCDLDVRIVLLPEGEDPDSLGPERLSALLARNKPALEEMMVRIAARAGTAAHARARGVDRVVPLIAEVRRDSARELYVDRASTLFDLPVSRVRSAVEAAQKASNVPRQGRRAQRNLADFHSISGQRVPHSAAVQSRPELPAGQSQLTMLLVDAPHLAAIAERSGARDCVTDNRLAPIAQAVLDGAKQGLDPTMPELLDLVDPSAQRYVHAAVFAGRYRAENLEDEDPQLILAALLHRCREEALEHDIAALDHEIQRAQDSGYPQRASELAQQRLAMRRRQAILRREAAQPQSSLTLNLTAESGAASSDMPPFEGRSDAAGMNPAVVRGTDKPS